MAFTQQTFLGSSIRNFSCNLGWGNQVSTLEVNLADDAAHGDSFNPPLPGAPCYFAYDDFAFGGLLQSYKTINTTEGYPTYSVTLVDPRELLEGVQLILNNYNGDTSSIPNLYNVYGYWENNSFGSSLINDGGMPWGKVVTGFTNLVALNPIQFKNYEFRIDLTALPTVLPDVYRINTGFSVNLMQLIDQICVDSGYDFFFTLQNVDGFNFIVLNTASRVTQPILGSISNFISLNTANTAATSEYGAVMRNETTSKFVVGGNIARIYLQTQVNTDEDVLTDDTILQFWGVNEDGTPIIGTIGDDINNYTFSLPSRFINVVGVGDTYDTDVFEMRAALGGQAGWETYLWSQNSVTDSVHETKCEKIGIVSNLRQDIVRVLSNEYNTVDKFRALDLRTFAPLTGKMLKKDGNLIKNSEENVKVLFDYIYNHANEHYGKKFMVRIPFTYAAVEPDTNVIRTSLQPCDGGYLSDTEILRAVDNGYLPPDLFNLTLEDGRVVTYCKFNYAQNLDLSDISPDDIVMDFKQNDDDENLIAYIRCDVDPKVYYLDNSTLFSPRVVVTLPGRVVPLEDDGNDFSGVLKKIFTNHATTNLGLTDTNTINGYIRDIFNRFGGEQLLYGCVGLAQLPDLIGVALQSNIETYGPWYSLGAVGKIETIQEPTLVPWVYGGYDAMNDVANSMVTEGVTYQQVAETGAIETPGSPALSLGDTLLSGGPYVTNISVNVGENGVTTTYRMETWVLRFGRLSKANIDRVNRLTQTVQAQKRMLQKLSTAPPTGSKIFQVRENAFIDKSGRRTPRTSNTYLAGEVFTNASGTKSSNVVIAPTYELPLTISDVNYSGKAFMSLDGMFRPFSTNPAATGIAKYETPTSSGSSGRSVTELDPFQVGNDIFAYARNLTLPSGDNTFINDLDNSDTRAMALRGPLVLSGWGYDTNGKPVPNSNESNPTDNFASNYLQNSDQWKTGPVDLKWDRTRKVWATSGGSSFRIAMLKQDLIGGFYASGVFLNPIISGAESNGTKKIYRWEEQSGLIRIYDGFEYAYPITPSGARVYISQEQSTQEWFVTAAGVV